MMRKTTQRKYDVLRAYLVATAGKVPTDLGKLLGAMQELIPGVSESELRKAIAWALHRKPRPPPRMSSSGNVETARHKHKTPQQRTGPYLRLVTPTQD